MKSFCVVYFSVFVLNAPYRGLLNSPSNCDTVSECHNNWAANGWVGVSAQETSVCCTDAIIFQFLIEIITKSFESHYLNGK